MRVRLVEWGYGVLLGRSTGEEVIQNLYQLGRLFLFPLPKNGSKVMKRNIMLLFQVLYPPVPSSRRPWSDQRLKEGTSSMKTRARSNSFLTRHRRVQLPSQVSSDLKFDKTHSSSTVSGRSIVSCNSSSLNMLSSSIVHILSNGNSSSHTTKGVRHTKDQAPIILTKSSNRNLF